MDDTDSVLSKMEEATRRQVRDKKIECQLAYFFKENYQLYKKGFALPSLRCLSSKEGNYMLTEIYEGICWNHLVRAFVTLKFV